MQATTCDSWLVTLTQDVWFMTLWLLMTFNPWLLTQGVWLLTVGLHCDSNFVTMTCDWRPVTWVKMCDSWLVTCNPQRMTFDSWPVTFDSWLVLVSPLVHSFKSHYCFSQDTNEEAPIRRGSKFTTRCRQCSGTFQEVLWHSTNKTVSRQVCTPFTAFVMLVPNEVQSVLTISLWFFVTGRANIGWYCCRQVITGSPSLVGL